MKKQIATRFVIGAVTIMILGFAYWWFQGFIQDPDLGDFDSVGHVVALELNRDGGRVVMFDENGKETEPPKPNKEQFDDRGVSWGSDGQRVFISSNRDTNAYLVYRWNPVKNVVERRSRGSISQGVPWFGTPGSERASQMGLLLGGGQILELDAKTGDTSQILPPSGQIASAGDEGGSMGAMSSYSKFGESFVLARPTNSEEYLYGLMRNESGFTVILQRLGIDPESGQPYRASELYRADRISLSTDQSGRAMVVVSGFQFPPYADVPADFIKDGKVVPPFHSAIFRLEIGANGAPISQLVTAIPNDGVETFGDAVLSANGAEIAVVIAQRVENQGYQPLGLLRLPFEENGGAKIAPVVQGEVSAPDWSPDGKELVYLKRIGSDLNVYRAKSDGSGEKKLSSGGTWGSPKFSPQLPK